MKKSSLLVAQTLIAMSLAGCSRSAPFDVHPVDNVYGGTSKMLEFWAKTDGVEVTKITANDGSCNADPNLGYPVKLTAQQPQQTGTRCTIISNISVETNQGTFDFSF
jgi:hypothetical protein